MFRKKKYMEKYKITHTNTFKSYSLFTIQSLNTLSDYEYARVMPLNATNGKIIVCYLR